MSLEHNLCSEENSSVILDHPYSLAHGKQSTGSTVVAQLGNKIVTKNDLQKQDALIKNIII